MSCKVVGCVVAEHNAPQAVGKNDAIGTFVSHPLIKLLINN